MDRVAFVIAIVGLVIAIWALMRTKGVEDMKREVESLLSSKDHFKEK